MTLLLFKASVLILALLGFYKLVLEKESFFRANRIYLLFCLILAFSLPFISLPQLVENQGAFSSWLEPAEEIVKSEMSSTAPVKEQINKSIGQGELNITNVQESLSSPVEIETDENVNYLLNLSDRGVIYWLGLLYLFGVIVLSINLIAQIIGTIYKVYSNDDRIADEDCVIVNLTSISEPCSFFQYIFINPSAYEYDTYEQIIEHEKIHVRQGHSLDLLLSELAVIFLWFNPFVWMLRKEVEKNIEYQTDDILVNGRNEIKEGYQMNLVNIAAYTKPLTITTNYNQSLIKQRIMKMNSKKSNKYNYWKYTFAAPLLFSALLLLNKPTVNAQNNGVDITNAKNEQVDDRTQEEQSELKKEEGLSINSDIAEEEGINISQAEHPSQDSPRRVTERMVENAGINIMDKNCRALLAAIREGDLITVKELISNTDVNCIDPNPGYEDVQVRGRRWRLENMKSPLTAASKHGNLEIVKLLVNANATVDMEVHGDATALVVAASYGNLEVIKYLLEQGADINHANANYGNALLSAASSGDIETIEFLVSKGLDVNYFATNQGTPLIVAASDGNLAASEYFIEKGADVNYHAPNQGTPLIAACHAGALDIVQLLISRGAKIDFVAPNQGNALIAACGNGNVDVARYLVSKGADVNAYSSNQGTALIMAANNGFSATVSYLISVGADVDFLSPNQGSALSRASLNGHTEIARLLASKVKDINAMSNGQGSALISAARNGQLDLVKLYLEKGADINANNDGQGFPLNAAATNGINNVIEYLLEAGAEINLQNDGQGSALNAAARNGHNHTIKLLLARGANINLQNDGQGSALNAAARNGLDDTVTLLLDNDANIDLQNDGQGSALNAAARNGHLSTVKLLLKRGADINQFSDGQGTALSAASKNRHQDIVDYLEAQGAKHIYGR